MKGEILRPGKERKREKKNLLLLLITCSRSSRLGCVSFLLSYIGQLTTSTTQGNTVVTCTHTDIDTRHTQNSISYLQFIPWRDVHEKVEQVKRIEREGERKRNEANVSVGLLFCLAHFGPVSRLVFALAALDSSCIGIYLHLIMSMRRMVSARYGQKIAGTHYY